MRKKKRKPKKLSQILHVRWLQNDNTRAATFADRKKKRNKEEARGRSYREEA